MQLVLLPDGYYSSAKRIIKAIDGRKHRMELKNKFHMFFSEINHKIDMKVKTDCYQSFITIRPTAFVVMTPCKGEPSTRLLYS
jgi:aspartate/methionine/tyrosine aminotransferase